MAWALCNVGELLLLLLLLNGLLQFWWEYDELLNKYMGPTEDGVGLDLTLVRHGLLGGLLGVQGGPTDCCEAAAAAAAHCVESAEHSSGCDTAGGQAAFINLIWHVLYMSAVVDHVTVSSQQPASEQYNGCCRQYNG
jgi:hypothetical protein